MEMSLKEAERIGLYLPNPDILIEAILSGKKTITLNEHEYEVAMNRFARYCRQKEALATCTNLNNKGVALEKNGKIKAAIKIYEKSIEGRLPVHHAYKRLMILYRQVKDFDNEIRVIHAALAVLGNIQEYTRRLKRTTELKNKRDQAK